MTTFAGHYYDGLRPIAVPAALHIEGGDAVLVGSVPEQRFPAGRLSVSPRIGSARRFIALPGGGQFLCDDQPGLDALPQESSSEGPVAWLEARWGVALAAVALTVFLLLGGYFFGLPVAAERVAARIPVETEQALGAQALDWLDEREWFKPTQLDGNTQQRIRRGFGRLRRGLPQGQRLRLEFRWAVFGANAFAFPGGTIVLTDDMVLAAETSEEVLAVLAHEIGHVELRHALRNILQSSAIAAVAAAVTSDAASLSAAVTGLPVLVAQSKYSRQFEAEADAYAFRLLKRRGHSPAAFAALMERLAQKHGKSERAFAYVSSHPVTADRVERARAAAR